MAVQNNGNPSGFAPFRVEMGARGLTLFLAVLCWGWCKTGGIASIPLRCSRRDTAPARSRTLSAAPVAGHGCCNHHHTLELAPVPPLRPGRGAGAPRGPNEREGGAGAEV